MRLNDVVIGSRVKYTDRDSGEHFGTVRGIAEGTQLVDVAIDGSHLERNHLPVDALELAPL